MKTIRISDKEKELILDGLQTAAARLRDFAHAYAMNNDSENAKDCLKEAGKYYDLANKIAKETAK